MKLYSKSVFLFLAIIFSYQSINASQGPDIVQTISTASEAIVMLRKIMIQFPTGSSAAIQRDYEKGQSRAIATCAKILYDNAYAQILDTLQEIDNRLVYWRDKRNHPWRYFLTKNPMKWVMGVPQKEEIDHNLDQLQNHQGELYVLLGQLAEYGNVYDHKYKTAFKHDYTQIYAWVDGLLDVLARIKVSVKNLDTMSPFVARVAVLKAKLERVRFFKNQILSEMKATRIPASLEQNWLKYGVATLILGLGYQNISYEQIQKSLDAVKNSFMFYIVNPVETIIKDIFISTGAEGELLVPRENIESIKKSMKDFVNELSISIDQKQRISEDIELGKSGSFQDLVYNIAKGWNYKKMGEGKFLLYEFLLLQAGERTQKQIAGVATILFLTPTILTGWAAYRKYQAMLVKDYTSIRRALVDINSLFVDTTRPLDDESYGKMLYLIDNLKKRAAKNIPVNDRSDFIHDLERVESKEFNVAAKRAIVDDMFRKYSFLKLT